MRLITPGLAKLVRHGDICYGIMHPITAQIVLTNRCNLRCPFCVESSRLDLPEFNMAVLKNILIDLRENRGCKSIVYSGGGEPTLHSSFLDIINFTHNLGLKIGLNTNGVLLRKFDGAFASKFDWIKISINSGRKNYAYVHGADSYDKVLNSLKTLNKFNCTFFGISFVYSAGLNTAEDFFDLVRDLACNKLYNIGYLKVTCDHFKLLSDESIIEIEDYVKKCGNNYGFYVDFQVSRNRRVPKFCTLYKVKPRIDVDGLVYPCCIVEPIKKNCIGDYSEYCSVLERLSDFKVDLNKCPYCFYKDINDTLYLLENTEVCNPDFI